MLGVVWSQRGYRWSKSQQAVRSRVGVVAKKEMLLKIGNELGTYIYLEGRY